MDKLIYIDSEISYDGKIKDLGALKEDGTGLHSRNVGNFREFIADNTYLVGHNLVNFDAKYLRAYFPLRSKLIDTLYVSPLLFPEKPYHRLIKDDKIQNDDINNPISDCQKCKILFEDELTAFDNLDRVLKNIYGTLLFDTPEFSGFFSYVKKWNRLFILRNDIKNRFKGLICDNADIPKLIRNNPVELAYALAIISVTDGPKGKESITPSWVRKNFPEVEKVIHELRGKSCNNCDYCQKKFDARGRLKEIFGFDNFRLFNGENLQEKAVESAVRGESLLCILPTGGGKSITFQVPAFIAGDTVKGLTIVISPLQSLMKDQVDNLEQKGSAEAVTINGLLNPIERMEAIERVRSGVASILYISPESLRSRTIENLILSRTVSRVVIDEAHCFSVWGQDFRVDYQYIGDFIRRIQELKNGVRIPVSCFTATAKQKVVSDIKDYFKYKLGEDLKMFTTSEERKNLHYQVIPQSDDESKYQMLRDLIKQHNNCPTIVFVSSHKNTENISERLRRDGFKSLPFHGGMDRTEKTENQNAFMANECDIIVATSAFGMGVDKKNVGLVVHYEISDSLENYIQEAGRAGREQSIEADCYILFNEKDLDAHFLMLNRSKLTMNEIQQVWKGIKFLTRSSDSVCCSSLELARAAGWDDSNQDIDTRVKGAIAALENAGYVTRGQNVPRVYADAILVKNINEAISKCNESGLFALDEIENVRRILSSLLSSKYTTRNREDEAETRIDYIADNLGLELITVKNIVERLRQADVLSDSKDLAVRFSKSDTSGKITKTISKYFQMENFLIEHLSFNEQNIDLKQLNEDALENGVSDSKVKLIKDIFFFWTITGAITKTLSFSGNTYRFDPKVTKTEMKERFTKRSAIVDFISDYIFSKTKWPDPVSVKFSVKELLVAYNEKNALLQLTDDAKIKDIEDAILYLSKIKAFSIDGGFLVIYNSLQIKRIVTDNHRNYRADDYKNLKQHYDLKVQQIHIVGEYANMMVKSIQEARVFVNDYFTLDYEGFIKKYFKGTRKGEIQRNITPQNYNKLFGNLSPMQKKIIDDDTSKTIAVIAGPGSGKTRLLVHKLASLLMLEDIKAQQLLMLTFSRAAAIEFKERLVGLIGTAAHYVEIKTFHSYCFDLLGKVGKEEEFNKVVKTAMTMIAGGEVEAEKITKSVLVIDEAQDINSDEFELIQALMYRNEEMRIIAVGDDDQNIFEFRGSSSEYLQDFFTDLCGTKYEMLENYRSAKNIVGMSNRFVRNIPLRLKTNSVKAVTEEVGRVAIIKHASEYFEESIANHIERINDGKSTIAILTNTNNEALVMLGILLKRGIEAKLIQTFDEFPITNLAEIRHFLGIVSQTSDPGISEKEWNFAIDSLNQYYGSSIALPVILKILKAFTDSTTKMYKTDLIEFLREVRYDDFSFDEKAKIVISTIHKSKGHEFDKVYLLLKNNISGKAEELRKLYVGMTRAKKELFIHTNGNSFDRYNNCAEAKYYFDDKEYSRPENLTIQLTHKDVNLGFFKYCQDKIIQLRAGDKLGYIDEYLMVNDINVVKFSKAFIGKIEELNSLGYKMKSADIRFMVYWKGQDDPIETLIILPNIYFELAGNE